MVILTGKQRFEWPKPRKNLVWKFYVKKALRKKMRTLIRTTSESFSIFSLFQRKKSVVYITLNCQGNRDLLCFFSIIITLKKIIKRV